MNNYWISVEHGLPGFDEYVLVWYVHPGRARIQRLEYQDKRGWHWSGEDDHYITHWMPLPRGPKEASDV